MKDRINKFPELIAFVESSYNPYAMRFEEKFYRILKRYEKQVNTISEINNCSFNTGRMIGATSWGLYQILGYNLYINLEYDKNIFSFLRDLTEQLEKFKAFVTRISPEGKYDTFVGDIVNELELIFNFIDAKGNADFIKNIFRKNKDRLRNITKFVAKYNGARAGTEAFYSYIRRMMIFYNKVYM